jgi:protein-S-isoprenylcysteine O-methyltransferase Ste14
MRCAASDTWTRGRCVIVALTQPAGRERGKLMNEDILISNLIPAMWVVWASYWAVSARAAKLTVRRESRASRLLNLTPLVIGALLLAVPHVPSPLFATRILPRSLATYFTGVALVFLGLAFAVWARRHIGTNWSGTVTVKQDHELVRTGPYRIVRHPIYTGLLAAFAGSAVARGELRGVWAILLCAVAFQIRVRLEERWMRQEFGAEYASYSAEVPALIPFWPC